MDKELIGWAAVVNVVMWVAVGTAIIMTESVAVFWFFLIPMLVTLATMTGAIKRNNHKEGSTDEPDNITAPRGAQGTIQPGGGNPAKAPAE